MLNNDVANFFKYLCPRLVRPVDVGRDRQAELNNRQINQKTSLIGLFDLTVILRIITVDHKKNLRATFAIQISRTTLYCEKGNPV